MNRSAYDNRFSLFPFIHSQLPVIRTPDNSNLFLFPLKVRVIGIRLYIICYLPLMGELRDQNWNSRPDTFKFTFTKASIKAYNICCLLKITYVSTYYWRDEAGAIWLKYIYVINWAEGPYEKKKKREYCAEVLSTQDRGCSFVFPYGSTWAGK